MPPNVLMSVVLPLVSGVQAVLCLAIGLRGIVSGKPFLISARWILVFVPLAFAPVVFLYAEFLLTVGESWIQKATYVVLLFMCILAFSHSYSSLQGYVAFGITDISFREGLQYCLKKLDLPYEESFCGVKLPTIGADLLVTVQLWAGTAELKIKQTQFKGVLRDVANEMNEYYRGAALTKVNLRWCIFYAVLGVVFAVLGICTFAVGRPS